MSAPGAGPGVLIVTGGGRGIGAAVARLAGAAGYDVCVNYVAHGERAEAVAAGIRALGRRAIAVAADVSREAEVLRLFATVDQALGPLAALVNNAGAITGYGPLAELGEAALRRNFEVNVIGPILCAREAVRRMQKSRGGRGGAIVNIASRAATMGMPNEYVHYAAAKGAVISFTIGLSKEVIGDGIRVNSVSPGLIDTEMQMPERFARLAPTVPIGRAGSPEEVAEAVLWLLSDKASYVTGADILIAGGR
jgi:NAD(P)-dependent dehydrogenase (short-subunit alcohol dehydrogenase family)